MDTAPWSDLRAARRSTAAATAVVVALLTLAGCAGETDRADAEGIAARIEPEIEAVLETVDPDGQVRAVLVYHDGEPVLERYTGATPEDY